MMEEQDRATVDPKTRFTDRVASYVRHRPSYPPGVLAFLRDQDLLRPGVTVADIGSGTGISSQMFLKAGYQTVGVEPNDAMRAAAEQRLAGEASFRSVAGSAEATTLPDESVDLVVAGQAFHWFDRPAARRDFQRILKPGGGVGLFWNTRKLTGSAFAEEYEALLVECATDYMKVRHDAFNEEQIASFFAPAAVQVARFPAEQGFDYAGLEGRLLSSSYTPAEGDPRRPAMLKMLREVFDRCQTNGEVVMEYVTEVYAGKIK